MSSVGLGCRGYSVQRVVAVVEQPASRTLACLFVHLCLFGFFSYVAQASIDLSNGVRV